jgi:hypothetical protein
MWQLQQWLLLLVVFHVVTVTLVVPQVCHGFVASSSSLAVAGVPFHITSRTSCRHRYHHGLSSLRLANNKSNSDNTEPDESVVVVASRNDAIRRLLFPKPDEEEKEQVIITSTGKDVQKRNTIINIVAVLLLGICGIAANSLFVTSIYTPSGFTRFSTIQFLAALGDPHATRGRIDWQNQPWGIWKVDPGPRGVYLRDYDRVLVPSAAAKEEAEDAKSVVTAPAGWTFDPNDWWLEEHGIIMEAPQFPVSPGRYLVTGGRSVTTGLTIYEDGRWQLDPGATLYDVTHLPCRSARYRPADAGIRDATSSPRNADRSQFPVIPGAPMPPVPGYSKQDYAVLFVVGKAIS